MDAFPILDLVVGLIFIYFLLSIICSSAVEMFLSAFKIRAAILAEWLKKIFSQAVIKSNGKEVPFGEIIMDHCLVNSLTPPGKSTSYTDAGNFVSALLERISFYSNPDKITASLDDMIEAIEKTTLLPEELRRTFLIYANEARDSFKQVANNTLSEIEIFRKKIENWYDTSMQRLGGRMRVKYARPITIVFSIMITGFLNADSISIAKYLYANPQVASKISNEAMNMTKNDSLKKMVDQIKVTSEKDSDAIKIITQKLQNINEANAVLNNAMPLGWRKGELKNDNGEIDGYKAFSKFIGLAATVLALVMGAPFWFDLLNKLANVRGVGNKPATTEEKDK